MDEPVCSIGGVYCEIFFDLLGFKSQNHPLQTRRGLKVSAFEFKDVFEGPIMEGFIVNRDVSEHGVVIGHWQVDHNWSPEDKTLLVIDDQTFGESVLSASLAMAILFTLHLQHRGLLLHDLRQMRIGDIRKAKVSIFLFLHFDSFEYYISNTLILIRDRGY